MVTALALTLVYLPRSLKRVLLLFSSSPGVRMAHSFLPSDVDGGGEKEKGCSSTCQSYPSHDMLAPLQHIEIAWRVSPPLFCSPRASAQLGQLFLAVVVLLGLSAAVITLTPFRLHPIAIKMLSLLLPRLLLK